MILMMCGDLVNAMGVLVLIVLKFALSASDKGCKNEGPCDTDWYCGNRDICRRCEVIADYYCSNRSIILERFPSCDAFCFKRQLEVKNGIIENQTALISQLNDTICNSDSGALKNEWCTVCIVLIVTLAVAVALAVMISIALKLRVVLRNLRKIKNEPSKDSQENTENAAQVETLLDQEDFHSAKCNGSSHSDRASSGYESVGGQPPETNGFTSSVGLSGSNFIPTTEDKGPRQIVC